MGTKKDGKKPIELKTRNCLKIIYNVSQEKYRYMFFGVWSSRFDAVSLGRNIEENL